MNTATIQITSALKHKEGTSQSGRPWTLYRINAADGTHYDTFDGALFNMAFQNVGRTARIEWDLSERGGSDLKSLVIDQTVPAVEPQPEPVRDRDTNGNADWDLIGLRKTRCALWAALFNGQTLAGMPLDSAITHGIALVRAAELDVFHRQPAQAQDDIPF